jgi:pyruvate, water dikinase
VRGIDAALSSGIPALDRTLRGVNAGDNIVWEIEDIGDYAALARPFARAAASAGRRLAYIRFGTHDPVLSPDDLGADAAETHVLDPASGFEPFLDRIHDIIRDLGRGAFYVFDCLSDVAADWYSDEMLGNLFMLTCPHLYDLETVTYFALRWGRHGSRALSSILETTQLYLEVHRHGAARYIRPVKVQHRYTSTMHMLHRWEGEDVRPVASSAEVAAALASSPRGARAGASRSGAPAAPEPWEGSARGVLSRDPALLEVASRWLTSEDLAAVRRRMIGTGLIGGKAVCVLLARAIIRRSEPELHPYLEEHDSFFVGSDVYCSFLVRNGVWWLRQRQRDPDTYLEGAEQARRRILTGTFPDETMRELESMVDYFGQSPYVVRSSSLLEDSFGSAFAGKYESVFCANQGPRERRIADFLAAVRQVYSSAMGESALRYRAERGLLGRDEQMALLVMRVSGTMYGRRFFPALAGVGYSYNPFVWSPDIDPRAGVLRLVLGLGTRAVNRVDDDYARLVALNAPLKRPESSFDEVCRYAQRKADLIDLEADRLVSEHVLDVTQEVTGLPLDLLVTRARGWEGGGPPPQPVTFDGLLGRTSFVEHVRRMLRALETAYGAPVDIELTANLDAEGGHRINLVQCRKLHVKGADTPRLAHVEVPEEDLIFRARGAVVGHSRLARVDRFVYVVPSAYAEIPLAGRHEVARVLGRLNRVAGRDRPGEIVLVGPGRWGTSSPDLGVPVSFDDISRCAVVCEIVAMREDLVPDVSLGTHFLNDLVECDMLYAALFPERDHLAGLDRFLREAPSRLLELVPDAERWRDVIRVVDMRDALLSGEAVMLAADAVEQRVECYRTRTGGS